MAEDAEGGGPVLLEVLSRYVPGRTEENVVQSESRWPILGPRSGRGISRLRSIWFSSDTARNATHVSITAKLSRHNQHSIKAYRGREGKDIYPT
jgi:hypothetical protein